MEKYNENQTKNKMDLNNRKWQIVHPPLLHIYYKKNI